MSEINPPTPLQVWDEQRDRGLPMDLVRVMAQGGYVRFRWFPSPTFEAPMPAALDYVYFYQWSPVDNAGWIKGSGGKQRDFVTVEGPIART
jgi:hypothetical protein